MSNPLRVLALAALFASPGCLGPLGEPYVDNWQTSWKFVDGEGDFLGERIPDGRFRVTGKDIFSAAFAWVPHELGEGAEVDASFRFEKPSKISGQALTGIQISSLGPEIPIFLLIQSLLQGDDVVMNIFAQAGPNLVFQKVITGQSHADLGVKVDQGWFQFYVNGQMEGQTPIPNPNVDWISGFGFSGLGKGEQVSLEAATVKGGVVTGAHTLENQVKRSIFKASEPIQDVLKANDGKRQTGPDLLTSLNAVKTTLSTAYDEAQTKLTDKKVRKQVSHELLDAIGKTNKLLKKVGRKVSEGKTLKPKKIRKSAGKLLRHVAQTALRLSTPPSNMPTP